MNASLNQICLLLPMSGRPTDQLDWVANRESSIPVDQLQNLITTDKLSRLQFLTPAALFFNSCGFKF